MKAHSIVILAALILTQATGGPDKSTLFRQRAKKQRPDTSTIVTTQLTGVVTDPSGAVVPGAEVTLKLPDGNTRTTRTDAEGRYRFANVAVGLTYTLRFSYAGFKVTELPNVVIRSGTASTVNMQLESGTAPTPSPSPVPSAVPSPSSSPGVSPTPTESPSPADLEAIIEKEVQKLRESTILFNPPREMQEQKTEKIEARISFQDIGSALAEGLEGHGPPETAILKVSPIMRVTLTGDPTAFRIDGSGAEQIVAGKPFAQWDWYVTPLKSGDQNLTLTATATIDVPGKGEKPAYIKTLEKPITIHVDRWRASKEFFANNWQWLWTVVLVPGVGLLWGLRRRRKRKVRAGFR
jgi:hypothetical protein